MIKKFLLLPCIESITLHIVYALQDEEWKLIDEGEFSNIKNNPMWQKKV